MTTALAVDWSGAARETGEKLWWALAVDGELVDLAPATRAGAVERVLTTAERAPDLVVGLDFAFSYPAWFVRERWASAAELWRSIDAVDRWAPPFWGWPGSRRPTGVALFRRADRVAGPVAGLGASKSPFQVGGPGAVGTGTIRGLPVLADLQDRGLAIWPFDRPRRQPVVAEIYPRWFTGPVVKSRFLAREAWWDTRGPTVSARLRARALCGEDAFDAAVSAVALSRDVTLAHPGHPDVVLEGWVAGGLPADA